MSSQSHSHDHDLSPWQHSHRFDAGNRRGESRTRWVLALTVVTMVAEIAAGWWTGSMALLADGWHMGTHALALGVAAVAYALARRHADDTRFSFGTWKIEVLGSFASALVLGLVAIGIAAESALRLWRAEPIGIEIALLVAVIGLVVNLASAWLLHDGEHSHDHHHDDHDDHPAHGHHGHDLNLRSAYLHVVADAATSVLAIAALLGGWFYGWSWLDQWVAGGRFRAEYIAGGVVSGRWATRGGGALQIPKVVRRAVVADPGWRFVVADAGQLEPRVLAAVSGDRRLAAAAAAGDLYAALAADSFDGDRAKAKVALLGAMYGQTGGAAIPALAVLRKHYPVAFEFVEAAARTGEAGGLVRSWLGRTCPPAAAAWRDAGLDPPDEAGSAESPQGGASGRARGRFTRNFVVQATAAEWALVLLARLRAALAGSRAELVFFQHDEVIVHCPAEEADQVTTAIQNAGNLAGTLTFGPTPTNFAFTTATVETYADAK